jgi:hypothetical protein
MYSIIPDIPINQELPPKAEKPAPIKVSGKKYEVLPGVGEFQPPSRDSKCTKPRFNPRIEPLHEAGAKSRIPLACLDPDKIQQAIIKAEKKDKKRRKKTTKPPPPTQPEYSQDAYSVPQVHIPHPPPYPLDPTQPRRLVRIIQPTGIRYMDVDEYISYVTSGYRL